MPTKTSLSFRTNLARSATLAILPSFLAACGSDAADTTTGKRIVLGTRVEGVGTQAAFTNAVGWTVTLTKAYVSTGAFYYFDGATIFSANVGPSRKEDLFDRLLGVRSAWAHPGHYVPGNARGQMLTPTSTDLAAGPASLADGEGVTGIVRSATFSFATPASGPVAAELGTHVAVLEGTASNGTVDRPFRVEVDASEVLDSKGQPSIEGCPFTETEMKGDGTVTLKVSAPLWFDQADFSDTPVSSDGRRPLLTNDHAARRALVRGMKAGDAYVFSYTAK
ncbi:MAG: hypothetical protein U0169_17280 [Polyangiaceae bacterium]